MYVNKYNSVGLIEYKHVNVDSYEFDDTSYTWLVINIYTLKI